MRRLRIQNDSRLGVTINQSERFRLGKGCKMNKVIKKTLWKVFPNTVWEIWREAHRRGVIDGKDTQRSYYEKNLREHDLKDFDNPALILGYNHAIKAMRGELTEVV